MSNHMPVIGLGAIVSFGWTDGHDQGTICKIHANGKVDVFRPYVHTSDYSVSGGEPGSTAITCYIGVETVKEVDPSKLKLLRKGTDLR